ncbi:hypothetical protein PMAC_001657 [Pneumocystis sp. 'macacae']|nr:hypothetical protein PMAC_001657 [Pneumocystis sp. 'macacae']
MRLIKRNELDTTMPDEEHLLAFILKEDISDKEKCKKRLEMYCVNLQEIDLNLDNMDPKLKKICNSNQQPKCEGLKKKLEKKSKTLKKTLETTFKHSVTYDGCNKYHPQCLFLEDAFPQKINTPCTDFRNKCYQKKRDELAEEILIKALQGSLRNSMDSEKKLEELCSILNEESDELMYLCLNQKETNEKLVKLTKHNCEILRKINETVLENLNTTTCYLLCSQCYFYQQNCIEKEIKKKCDEIKKKCKDQKVECKSSDYHFSPIEPKPTLQKIIGLEESYELAEHNGLLVGKPHKKTLFYLFLLLALDDDLNDADNDYKCQEALGLKCSFLTKMSQDLGNICTNETYRIEKCNETRKFQKKCSALKKKIFLNNLSTTNNTTQSKLFTWRQLSTSPTKEELIYLLSECYYLEGHCPFNLNAACKNVKSASYKKGLDAKANNLLEEQMRGMLHNLTQDNGSNLKKCQEALLQTCKNYKNKNEDLFILCMTPKETCLMLESDIKAKVDDLHRVLNKIRDKPNKHNCIKFQILCKKLGSDSKSIHKPCDTLKERCIFLENIEQLKKHMLEKKKDFFLDKHQCMKNLKEECLRLFRKEKNQFNYSCVALEESCDLMISSVMDHCTSLKENMKELNIINKVDNDTEKEDVCLLWMPYCDKLAPNCNYLLKENNKIGLCSQLKEKCKSFLEKKGIEEMMTYKLGGALSTQNECKEALNKYCVLSKTTNNFTVFALCKNITANRGVEKAKEDLCIKFVSYVFERCPELLKEIMEAKDDLEKERKEFEKIKKEAEEAIKDTRIILSTIKTNGSELMEGIVFKLFNGRTVTLMKSKSLKKENINIYMTEKESTTFKLIARVFDLYVELKEKCYHFLKECVFKKECQYQNECQKIESACKGLKAFDIASLGIKTVIKTVITKNNSITQEGRTESKEKAIDKECIPVNTINTWITHTFIHTSILTKTSILTSTATLTSKKKCKPTKCIKTQNKTGVIPGAIIPSSGMTISGWNIIKGIMIQIIILVII